MPKLIIDFNRKSVIEFIAAAREEQGIGVVTLEKKAGVSVDTIRDFERGKAHLIRADKLKKILNALGYDLVITKLAVALIIVALLLTGISPALALDVQQFQTEQQAQEHCPQDTVVWLNTNSGVYHFRGQRWYGNTKSGAYVCEQE